MQTQLISHECDCGRVRSRAGEHSDRVTQMKPGVVGVSPSHVPVVPTDSVVSVPTGSSRTVAGVSPSHLPAVRADSVVSIPKAEDDGVAVDQPTTPGGGGATSGLGGTAPGATGGACGAPSSISKVTSGALAHGLSMDDYYPDLVGRGFYSHPTTAGPFDTGSRAGANVQIVAIIPASCPSSSFALAQTVTYTRRIWNGVHDPLEGRSFDDIAKSGRNASGAPFRQEWSGPAGFVSMADPPSIDYSAYSSAEVDRDFVTSLIGPSGRVDVSWSTSIRVAGGRLTSNTVT